MKKKLNKDLHKDIFLSLLLILSLSLALFSIGNTTTPPSSITSVLISIEDQQLALWDKTLPKKDFDQGFFPTGAFIGLTTNNFTDDFANTITIEEAGSMSESRDSYWWLSSGAYIYKTDGRAKTVQGELPLSSKWQKEYQSSNPTDTDNGYHPQNIFRLVTKSKWQNLRQQVYFQIIKDQLSTSPNRGPHNGLLLMSRYIDEDSLYYTGIRVDGSAVIKKKKDGTYYTLGYKKIFPGTYNKNTNPDLLPKNKWLGLRTEIKNNADQTVNIKLFMDQSWTGNWKLILEAKDDARSFGGAAITSGGFGGMRTDFMDVIFDGYNIEKT